MIFNDIKDDDIKSRFVGFWNDIKNDLPKSADKTLCMRKLQEAYFFACCARKNDGEYQRVNSQGAYLNNGNQVLTYKR